MKITRFLVCLALLAASSVALAGYHSIDGGVTILLNGDGSGSASANMPASRFTKDDNSFIGCGLRTIALAGGGVYTYGFCQAGDEDVDNYHICYTDDPALLDIIRSLSAFSYIGFRWSAGNKPGFPAPQCAKIDSSTQSFYIPNAVQRGKK